MSTDRTHGYAQAVVALATGEGALDAVEDELLTVARAIDGNEDLRRRLTDINLPLNHRLAFIDAEILAAAHPATRASLAMLIAAERIGEVDAIADLVAQHAAASRDEQLAEVYVAVPLDEARTAALKAALERSTGMKLDVKVYVDESVLGGVRAHIGDTVLDGSLARRLDDIKTRVNG